MDTSELVNMRGAKVVDPQGDKIGKVEEIYLDKDTDQPEFALINTGLFGSKSTFVPLQGVSRSGDDLQVQFDKETVKDAPGIEPGRELSESEEAELYRHYGMDYSESRSDSGLPEGGPGDSYDTGSDDSGTVGRDVSGPSTDDAMTRSEEELRVGTESREVGKARLRKHVVTENVQTTVPVQREEVRVEREPITDENVDAATEGPAISEEEHEVTLREEVPVVEKEAVPQERVRLDRDTVSDEHTVSDEVRKEQVDVEDERSGR